MIINNNNNNGGSGMNYSQFGVGEPARPARKSEISILMSQPLKYDRLTMIKLARYMGWCGLHFFHFKRPFLGICHVMLSLIGILGIMSLPFLIFFGDEACFEMYLTCVSASVVLLLVSVFGGILYSMYWSIHSDEEFDAAFPREDNRK